MEEVRSRRMGRKDLRTGERLGSSLCTVGSKDGFCEMLVSSKFQLSKD